jgi:hypothetical protein
MSNMSQPFTSDHQVLEAYEFFKSMQKPACPDCARGIRMCYHTPCQGTVEDIERLIDAGYAKNLMLDWWVGEDNKAVSIGKSFGVSEEELKSVRKKDNPFTEDVMYLIPAIVGIEGKQAPFIRSGKCNLLVDNKCSLHDKGLKPTQGQYACCKTQRMSIDKDGKEYNIDERIFILHTWNTQRGKDLIERWKKEVNFDSNQAKPKLPETPIDMIEALLDVMSWQSKLYEEKPEDGRPIIDPNEDIQVQKTFHNTPY